MIIRRLTMAICLVRSYVFYHIENQVKIIVVYISMEKSDQAQFLTKSSSYHNFW